MADFFLGRGVEQKKFREMGRSLVGSWWSRTFPTVTKTWQRVRGDRPPNSPQICLFYGEGGMGKTTLSRRLQRIAETEKPLAGRVLTVRLDWEAERDRDQGLQVGHDSVEPETVLAVLCRVLAEKTEKGCFKGFWETQKQLRTAEEKVDKALKQQDPTSSGFDKNLVEGGVRTVLTLVQKYFGMSDEAAKPYMDFGVKATTELTNQAVRLVERSLKAEERELFKNPRVRLAQALGEGLAKCSARRPVVVFLDTYEIVDRPECDLAVREVMRAAGARVLWVVTGRANLADSGRRGDRYIVDGARHRSTISR